MADLIEKALSAKRESKQVEFKEGFDPSSPQDWCEITKDIVAIANSGGGMILFGAVERRRRRVYGKKNRHEWRFPE